MLSQRWTTQRETVSTVLWIWILAALALTACLIVVGGFFVLESTTVKLVLTAMAIAATVHFARAFRQRHDIQRDPRMRWARERRGF